MNEVAIITDSTSYLPPELITEYDIKVIPLAVIWDGESFADGVDITPTQFYMWLAKGPSMPSTSQPPEAEFVNIFTELLNEGKDVLAILISSGISGTVNSALQAKAEIGSDHVVVIDSQTAAMATGLHILAAARKAAAGGSLEEVKEVALKAQQQTNIVFAVDTLEFLHKGGRIGGAKRLMGDETFLAELSPVIGTHVGPGTVAIAFMRGL